MSTATAKLRQGGTRLFGTERTHGRTINLLPSRQTEPGRKGDRMKRRSRILLALATGPALLLVASGIGAGPAGLLARLPATAALAAAPSYTVTDLGSLGGGDTYFAGPDRL